MSAALTSAPGLRTTSSSGRSSHLGCLMPIAAASATPAQPTAAFSSSTELIHSPPDLITSLERSVICIVPQGWMTATSPVSNQCPRRCNRLSRPGNTGGSPRGRGSVAGRSSRRRAAGPARRRRRRAGRRRTAPGPACRPARPAPRNHLVPIGGRRPDRADRRGLGHAPGMADADPPSSSAVRSSSAARPNRRW